MEYHKIYALLLIPFLGLSWAELSAQVDLNGNSQSDIWERVYDARDLLPGADADGDGMSNAEESIVGTDPFDSGSFLKVDVGMDSDGALHLSCPLPNPKRYDVYFRESLSAGEWILVDSITTYAPFAFSEDTESQHGFYRIDVVDADSDGDGLTDWEELELGFDPSNAHTDFMSQTDLSRISDALDEANVITLHVVDSDCYEDWPDPAAFVIRRSGGIDPIVVSLSFSGTASSADYTGINASVSIPPGMSDTYLRITPVADALTESAETLTISLVDAVDYDLGETFSGTITIHDSSEEPSPKEAARLLAQASFGATPSDILNVQTLGIEGWIDAQMTLAPNLLQTATELANAHDVDDPDVNFYGGSKLVGWWENAIHADDQLRQRVAFALSQILVVSDDAGMIDGQPIGMANYYDIFVRNAFGNYRDILEEVTYHPVMGIYLSHKGNRAPDPSIGRFPDENYAREIMQLFSIGLWMLNQDGSRILDTNGDPIPTYTNFEISELARVFTGMNWGTNDPLYYWTYSTYPYESELDPYTVPMQFWEGEGIDPDTGEWLPYNQYIVDGWVQYFMRDKGEKHLVNGVIIPEGQLGAEDVSQALDGLFNHPNVAPFVAYRLIQRLVKSNPSPAYISRVSAAFNDNGNGVRGDMAAVIKAILMDSEARAFSAMNQVDAGKQREPYLRLVNLGRSFDVSSSSGPIVVFWNEDVFQQMPMSAPSVFNFYTPAYAPPGEVKEQGLVAPEFQITTTVSAMTVPNEFYWMTRNGYISWFGEPYRPTLDYTEENALADDPDALIAHLDGLLTYGNLSLEQQSIIRFSIQRMIERGRASEVVGLAIYLIMTSPDYVIQK